jgi:hypothetical protein
MHRPRVARTPMTSLTPSEVNLSDSPTTTELASVVETLVAQQAEAQDEIQ